MKHFMVHGAQTLQASSARILIALASVFYFRIQSTEIKLAELKSTETLRRRVFPTNPVDEFNLDSSQCFELPKPLYGLCNAGDLWLQSLNRHLTKELSMNSTICYKSLYLSFRKVELIGIVGSCFDDIIRASTPEFHELCQKTHRKFETNGDQDPPFNFAGLNISPCANHAYTTDQKFYTTKFEELDKPTIFSQHRSMRMELSWLGNSRPDVQFEISQLAQVTQDMLEKEPNRHVKSLNSFIRYAHNIVAHLKFPDLDHNSLWLVGYSDSAYTNSQYLSSQLGRIVLLINDTDRFHQFHSKAINHNELPDPYSRLK